MIYVRDLQPDSVFVITAYDLKGKTLGRVPTANEKAQVKKQNRCPKGWDETRVLGVLQHCESQTEEEAVAEDEAAFRTTDQAVAIVPKSLVPAVTKLISRKQNGARGESNRR